MVNSCNVDLCAHVYETCNQDVLKGSTLHYSCDGLQFHIHPLSPFLGGCFLGIFVLIDSVAASPRDVYVLFWPRQQCTAVLKVRMSKRTLVLLDESND